MEILKIILSTLWSAVTIFIIAKITGHKQISQLDFFDYVNGITIGSIAAELSTELENPVQPFVAMIVYGLVAYMLSVISGKIPRLRKYINGTPTILFSNGKLYRANLKKSKLDLSEFMVMCRQQGYFDLNDIETAVFEYNGKLSILPVSRKRFVTPEDLNINPDKADFPTEIIMDGYIIEKNLKRRGLDLNWLKKQLKEQGYKSAKEIFLGLCDSNNNLSLFKNE